MVLILIYFCFLFPDMVILRLTGRFMFYVNNNVVVIIDQLKPFINMAPRYPVGFK